MLMQYGELGDTLYFGFAGNDTSGSAVDGTTPLYDVRLAGAAASAAPVLSGTPALLSHANFGPGLYEVAVAATSGNGFATGSTYLVYATGTFDSQTPGGFIGAFSLGKLQTAADNGLILETTINVVTSTTVFTLVAGSDQNSAYVNFLMEIEDVTDPTRRDLVWANAYTGSTKTVTLAAATATFTAIAGDVVRVFAAFHPQSNAFPNVNVQQINDVTIVGDGSATPFNV